MDLLNQILKKILSSNPDLGKGIHEARILELWPTAIGSPLSKHAKAVQIKGTTLFVSVEQAVWRQELHANKSLVIKKLNDFLIQNLGSPPGKGKAWIEELFFVGSTSNRPTTGKRFQKK